MKKFIIFLLLLIAAPVFSAETYYLDRDAASSGNGSEGSPWKYYSDITGLSAGDTVYISPSSTAYDVSSTTMTPFGGNDTSPITYQINPTAGSGETATFSGGDPFVGRGGVVVSGDAGDGERHFVFSGGTQPLYVSNSSGNYGRNIEIAYIDMGTREYGMRVSYSSGLPTAQKCSKFNIHHNYLRKTNDSGSNTWDSCGYFEFSNGGFGTWGVNEIHHNEFWVALHPTSTGFGDDCLKLTTYATDIYNNTIRGFYDADYNHNQHTDGIQSLSSSYLRIYNNTFKDINNYSVFLESYYGNHSNFEIYNNLIALTLSHVYNQSTPVGIVTSAKQSSWDVNNGNIFNNTIVDYDSKSSIITNDATGNGTYTNVGVYNNALVNSGSIDYRSQPVDHTDNISVTEGNAPDTFVSYTAYSDGNNYNLKSTDTALKNQGCSGSCGSNNEDLTAVTTTDIDGTTRAGTWDVGAYEYSGTTAPSIVISSPTSNPTITVYSSAINIAGTAYDDIGVASVTWACPTCSTTSGTASGTSSWTISGVTYAEGANVVTVTATDGGGLTGQDSITVTYSAADTDPPTISNTSPSGALVCTEDPRDVVMSLSTNEYATCRYDTSDVAYASMGNTFSTTGTTSHSQSISVVCGTAKKYYIRCIDGDDNANLSSTIIQFSVASGSAVGASVTYNADSAPITYNADGAPITLQ